MSQQRVTLSKKARLQISNVVALCLQLVQISLHGTIRQRWVEGGACVHQPTMSGSTHPLAYDMGWLSSALQSQTWLGISCTWKDWQSDLQPYDIARQWGGLSGYTEIRISIPNKVGVGNRKLMLCERVVQYTQTAANRQRQLTNRQTGSQFAAKWCCDTGDLKNHLLWHGNAYWKSICKRLSYSL